MQELYILTKHAHFSAEYVENLPVWKRRYYIHLLEEEVDAIKAEQEKQLAAAKSKGRGRK